MPPGRPLRILAMLEAESISGSAKGVLEFARQAGEPGSLVNLEVMKFSRGPQQPNALTRAIQDIGIPLHVVYEQQRFDGSVVPQLRQLADRLQPDLIWSNSVKSHFLVRWAGLHRNRAWVGFHHGYTTTDTVMRVYNQLDYWSLRAADRLLTVCRPFAEQLVSRGVSRDKIQIQHMPVRPFLPVLTEQAQALRQQLGAHGRVLLSVGRLSREKGHLDLLHAFARIRQELPDPHLRLILVGEGPERPRLEQTIAELQLQDQVRLTGQQDDVRTYYSIADLFLLTSHSEGSPNVLLESMAAGVPVVATAVGGVPELAVHGHDALLVPKGDPQAIAAAAVRILSDEGLRTALSAAASQVVSRETPQAYFAALRAVFTQAVGDALAIE